MCNTKCGQLILKQVWIYLRSNNMRLLIILLNLINVISNISWYKNFGVSINNPECMKENLPIMEYYKIDDYQYMFFSERVSWNEARVICPNYDSQLAVVDIPAKAYKLAAAIAESNIEMEDIWIGGKRSDSGTWTWIDKEPIPSEPMNGFPPWVRTPNRPSKKCLAMDRVTVDSPLFVDLDCHLLKPFVCQRDIDGPVNSDVILPSYTVTSEASTYIFYHSRVCWVTAVAFCRMHGYRLAIIPDNKIAKIISTAMVRSRPSFEDMWISGHFYHGTWEWLSTGEVIENYPNINNYPPWHHNSTNHTSGCILFDRYLCEDPVFLASKCDLKRDFICEKYQKKKPHRAKVGPMEIVYQNWTMILFLKDLSWYDAQDYCKDQNAYLTEVYDYDMMRAITTAMSDQESEPLHVWLGGMKIRDTWVWIHNNQSIPATIDDETGFVPWCHMEEDYDDDNECLNMDREAHDKPTVYGLSCKVEQPFVCTRATNGDSKKLPTEETAIATTQPTIKECKQKPVISAINGKAYVTFFTPVTYSNAKAACSQSGTDLAQVKIKELESLVNDLRKNTVDCAVQHLWIKTTETCSYIRFDRKKSYKSEICSSLKGYICEIYCNQTIPTSPPFSKDMWNCAEKNLKMCKVLPSCPDTTTSRTTSTTKTTTSTCKHSAISIRYQTKAYEIFFTPYAYDKVATECSRAGGFVARIDQETVAAIVNSILNIKEVDCSETSFWVLGDEKCSQLNVNNKAVQSTKDCIKHQGFICETICSVPKSVDAFNQTIWNCDQKNYLECTIECVDSWVLVGPDTMICTNAGWVTNYNQTTYLPSCRKQNSFADEFSENMQGALAGTYSGLLFIVDESYSITFKEWLLQLQFVASMIQAFPLSSTFPMGLILFSSNATVTIPYNATDTCKVLEILNELTPAKDRDFTTYKDALEEGAKQIKELHDDRETLIFFISDGDNNGDLYTDILAELKEKHLIISIGISDAQMDDLNEVASTRNNHLLMFKFKIFEDLETFTNNFIQYRSKKLTCRKELYTLSSHARAGLRQVKPTTISSSTPVPTCGRSATLLPHKTLTFVIFFNRRSYKTASNLSSTIGGNLAELKPEYVREVVDAVSKVDDATCRGLNFWVEGDTVCKELNIQKQSVHVSNNCVKQQGYICEIVCSSIQPSATFNQTNWNCKHEENKLSCEPQCEAESVLIGSDYVTCTNAGWVTKTNQPTLLPSCQDQPMAADSVKHLSPVSEPHNGFLFVVDESYSISIPEWWIQMQFVASIIQMFPLSSNLPMGLILFAKEVRVPIPYNATDTCKVLETIRELRPSAERDFTYYDQALKEADNQIKQRGNNKSTVIFFISDGDHNGESYKQILEELRKRHTIISVGISSDSLNDLNQVAGSKNKSLLMYKFENFNSFQRFALSLMKFRSKTLKCKYYMVQGQEKLYTLPESISDTPIQQRMFESADETICNNQSNPIEANGVTYTIFYHQLTYSVAKYYCKNLDQRLANEKVNELEEITSLITKRLEMCKDPIVELWVNRNNSPCGILDITPERLRFAEFEDPCSKQLSFICETGCPDHPTDKIYAHNTWRCSNHNNVTKCHENCKNDAVMVGTNTLICSATNGWVTLNNYPTNFPVCLMSKDFESELINQISKLKKEHHGFLFVFDTSSSTSTQTVIFSQLEFIEALLEVFPPSTYFPVGLILFDKHATVPMAYLQTSFCMVLHKLEELKKTAAMDTPEQQFSFYDVALLEAQKQIEILQPRRKTVIFFVSDNLNNGGEYIETAINLKKKHTIFSIGNDYDALNDLNIMASMNTDGPLMYNFKNYKHLDDIMKLIKTHHGKQHKCGDV